jgi:uncharacterized protein
VARRFLVRRHLLAPPRSLPPGPDSVLAVVERLGSLQFDPLEVAGRNHDLVLLARIAGYRRAVTDELLYERRVLFEAYNKGLSILPLSELPYHRLTWDRHRVAHDGGAFDAHAPLVEELLERIRVGGRLSSTDIEPRAAIEWSWRPTNQVRALLEALAEAGILGIAGREGNRRVYDLAERLFPAEILAVRLPERDQYRHRLLSRYRAHGLLGTGGQQEIFLGIGPGGPFRTGLRQELVESGAIVPVSVEGVRGERFVLGSEVWALDEAEREVAGEEIGRDAAGLGGGAGSRVGTPLGGDGGLGVGGRLGVGGGLGGDGGLGVGGGLGGDGSGVLVARGGPGGEGLSGVAFLAPLDPFVWDRELLRQLFGFDYIWEVYVPERKRRWGYYVLPILFGDRLVGRLEPRIDRKARALRILDFWWEDGFDPLAASGFVDGLVEAIVAHREFGGVPRVVLPRRARHRDLTRALRERLG